MHIFIHLIILCFSNIPEIDIEKTLISEKAKQAIKYCESEKLNTDYCVLISMNKHSGYNRFYLWDFNKNKIILKSLCSHGCCENTWSGTSTKNNPKFSNIPESHCSSYGKYKIGNRGYSNWGININYKLYGLDSSNSNAYKRIIVLHSWNAVSESEIYPYGTPEGFGCPAISNEKMKKLDKYLINNKDILLWIYK